MPRWPKSPGCSGRCAPADQSRSASPRRRLPTVSQALSRLRRLGYEQIAVATYFMAPGQFLDAVQAAAIGPAGVAADAVTVTAPLADTDAVARLVLDRYAEALAGQARMNCDCRVYRAPWPGHEQRVGQPQRPHPHPAERR